MSDKVFHRGDLIIAQQRGIQVRSAQARMATFLNKLNKALVSAFGKDGPNWTMYH
jgi:hypothetical protein